MTHLKTIEGNATLIIDGSEAGIVDYLISVFQDRGLKRADGRMNGSHDILAKAFDGRNVSLRLSNGDIIEIGLREYRLSDDWATIAVLGSVPGA